MDVWGSGADFNPVTPSMSKFLPKFHLHCCNGDAQAVEASIAEARAADVAEAVEVAAKRAAQAAGGIHGEEDAIGDDDECPTYLTTLLEHRASMLRLPPIISCINGARMISKGQLPRDVTARADHLRVARALLSAGCRVDARDVAGHTPLHHCTTSQCSDESIAIASLLIARGADVEAKIRAGSMPIAAPMMSRKLNAVTLLLGAGANPDAKLDFGSKHVITPRSLFCMAWLDGKNAISVAECALAKAVKVGTC
jgi:hypothetical protein